MLHVQQRLTDENGRLWEPRNSNKKRIGEMVSVQWGLQNSDNWVTAWLMSQLSPYTFIRLLHSFGLKNEMDPVVSICLGTPDVSVGEMVSGYTTFANKGIRVEPLYVTRIEDPYGNTIANFNSQMSEVLTEDASYKMLHMLKNVIDGGTGGRIRARYGIKAPMGGKTGTAQQSKVHPDHVLFAGYAPADDPQIAITVRIANGYSSNYAAEIGRDITKVYFDANAAKDLITGKASSLGKAGSGD